MSMCLDLFFFSFGAVGLGIEEDKDDAVST